jgi:predicted metal-dependent hydrolase
MALLKSENVICSVFRRFLWTRCQVQVPDAVLSRGGPSAGAGTVGGVVLDVAGERIDVAVRRSPRARSWRLTVAPRRPVELVVPRGVRDAEIARILDSKREWIEARLAEIRSRPLLGLDRPGIVWLHGEAVPVVRVDGARPRAELGHGRLVVAGADANAVERWYRREARARIGRVVAKQAARLGLDHGRVSIRDQRTRWGSCSSRGGLSFSWRLVVPPADVLGYVVVHELCHLRQPNHSRRFWRLVEDALPAYRDQVRWLREHGDELQAYDPAQALVQGDLEQHDDEPERARHRA